MFKLIASLIVLLFLAGCFDAQMNNGLQALGGSNIETAFRVLGYPDAQQKFGYDTMYIWQTRSSGAIFIPQTSTTFGHVGSTPVYGTTTYNQPIPVTYSCTIKIVTDSLGAIKYSEWGGNAAGCQRYASRLDSYYRNSKK